MGQSQTPWGDLGERPDDAPTFMAPGGQTWPPQAGPGYPTTPGPDPSGPPWPGPGQQPRPGEVPPAPALPPHTPPAGQAQAPTSTPWTARPAPGQAPWSAPLTSQPTWPSPTPGGPGWTAPPARPRTSRAGLVAAIVAGVLVLGAVGWYVAGLFLPGPLVLPSPAVTSTAPATSTAAPSTAATSEPVTGGGIGREVSFETGIGSGVVTATSAVWTDQGEMAPRADQTYLVVDLTFRATAGQVLVSSLFVDAVDAAGEHYLGSYGPSLTTPLDSRLLEAGETASGQVGFELPRGAVTVRVLDESLQPVATIDIPER